MTEAAQNLSGPSDSADVTLASQDPCKFHQRGHCKFGETCKHFHTKYTCPNPLCGDPSCTARHPRICVYHAQFGHCRFGNACSYRHQETNDIEQLKIDLQQVIISLKTKESEMKKLEEKIILLEKSIHSMKIHEHAQSFKCNQCEYECATSTALKSHTTKKHKVECLRESSSDPALEVSLISEDRDEYQLSDSPSISSTFSCNLCNHETASITQLNGHIAMRHNPSTPHPSKWEPNTCHICSKSFFNTNDFKNHMVKHHGFSEDIDVCSECDEASDPGHFRVVPGQQIFMECKLCLTKDDNKCFGGP